MKYNIVIGGAAGQGVKTLSKSLTKILKHHGYYTFTNTIYMSRIRGGHNYFQLRFSDQPIYTHEKEADLIVALNSETYTLHKTELKNKGIVLSDASLQLSNKNITNIDAVNYAKNMKIQKLSSQVYLGAIAKLFDLDKRICEETLNDLQIEAFKMGYDSVNCIFNTVPTKQDKTIQSMVMKR